LSDLKVTGFGGLELSANGHTVQNYPTHHVQELLGYLVLNQDRQCERDELIELLWPHDISKNARSSLNTVLWRLRGVFRQMGLGARTLIHATRDHIIFAPKVSLEFDVASFEHLLDIAGSTGVESARQHALTAASSLYRGDLYPGVYADWCLIERERLARMHLRALGDLVGCYIGQFDFTIAVQTGQTILSIDPLREEVHRALIFCYGQLGQRSSAVAQFELCADLLMTELQVLPMPDTVRVFQRAMASRPSPNLTQAGPDLLNRAYQASAEFQQAGSRLIAILEEIENLESSTAY
jgi:DNA-binding SARP family transcriptional activator